MRSQSHAAARDRFITAAVIIVSMAIALAIRILWPYDTVFVDGAVWFREMDAYYHMRLVDNLVHNFPLMTAFDPYSYFPYGVWSTFHPLTTWFIAVPAFILGGGSPSPELVDLCGAYFPPVLGALTVIPVYFLGRHLYGRIAGAASALLIAVLPGEFLSRSLLGFTDHHVTEAFFSTAALLFLMCGLRQASRSEVTLTRPANFLSPAYRLTLTWALLAGLALGLYLLAWRGGVLVLAILVLYIVIRSVMDYFRGARGDDLILVFPVAGAVATLVAIPTMAGHAMTALYVLAMLSLLIVPIVLRLYTNLANRLQWSGRLFLTVLCGSVAAALIVLSLVSPTLAGYIRSAISFMIPTGAHLTIMEMHPLFFPGGSFSPDVAWYNFVAILPFSIIGLVLLVRSSSRPRGNDVLLFVVWSIVMLVAVLLQRRFGYYYAINAAVLCGFFVGWIFALTPMRRLLESAGRRTTAPTRAASRREKRALQAQRADRRTALVTLAAVTALLAGVLVAPAVPMARNFATEPGLMTAGWYEAATWLREHTPPPLEPDAYYDLHDVPESGTSYPYPDTAYGVMAWWDYGHYITRLGHRIPAANPFQQGARSAGLYFTSQSEDDGLAVLDELGCRYVMVDGSTSVDAFHAVASWAGLEPTRFRDVYYQRTPEGQRESITLYYPEYYQTMLVRLYTFAGQSHEPEEFTAIRYESAQSRGRTTRTITTVERFPTYDEALTFLAGAEGNWRLVSENPLVSAVPLTELQHYSLVYETEAQVFRQARLLPEVRVFELTGANPR